MMLGVLEDIFEVFTNIPQYILYAIESFANLFFSAIQEVFNLATSLIPLPAEPAVPPYISAINWFFPVGAVISIMTPILAGYVSFLAVRWILRWSGEL